MRHPVPDLPAQRVGEPARVADGARQRVPTGEPPEFDDRWCDRAGRQNGGRTSEQRCAVLGQSHHGVRVLDDAFQPVLGHQDGDTEIVHQAHDGGQHLLSGGRVEGRSRLIQHQDARVAGQHGSDGDPLLLPGRELRQRAVAELPEGEQVDDLLHPFAHRGVRHPELLQAVGEFVVDPVGDESGNRILADHPHDAGQVPRWVCARVQAGDRDGSAEPPAGEVGCEAVHQLQQGGLAGAGRADHEAQLAFRNRQGDIVQHRSGGIRVAEAHLVQSDHRAVTTTIGDTARAAQSRNVIDQPAAPVVVNPAPDSPIPANPNAASAAIATPLAAMRFSRERHGSGRYLVVRIRRDAILDPRTAAPAPATSTGMPSQRGEVPSSSA